MSDSCLVCTGSPTITGTICEPWSISGKPSALSRVLRILAWVWCLSRSFWPSEVLRNATEAAARWAVLTRLRRPDVKRFESDYRELINGITAAHKGLSLGFALVDHAKLGWPRLAGEGGEKLMAARRRTRSLRPIPHPNYGQ